MIRAKQSPLKERRGETPHRSAMAIFEKELNHRGIHRQPFVHTQNLALLVIQNSQLRVRYDI